MVFSMGWIQITYKNFRDKVPNRLSALEVWEPAGFGGEMLHLKGEGGIETPRARRTIYETEAEAMASYEDPRKR